MKSLLCKLLAVLSISGCYGNTWVADERFTVEERAQVEQGADLWREIGQSIDIVYGQVSGNELSGRHIIRATGQSAADISAVFEKPSVAGNYLNYGFKELIVLVPERAYPHKVSPLYVSTAHELGHSLGMEHVSDPRALMFYKGSTEMMGCLTKADVLELCNTAGCAGEVPRGCDE
jgi:hypothetical protein